jgi:hypothetical protein
MLATGVDRATLGDFLAFDGDLASVTDRMMAAFVWVVSAFNQALMPPRGFLRATLDIGATRARGSASPSNP